jgi:hypothetical protein
MQGLDVLRHVARRHRLPEHGDFGQGIGQTRGECQVLPSRGPPLAGRVVEDLGGAAVDREMPLPAVEAEIGPGAAGAENERARRFGQRILHLGGGKAQPFLVAVDPGAGLLQGIEELRRGNSHAHPLEHHQGFLVHLLDRLGR